MSKRDGEREGDIYIAIDRYGDRGTDRQTETGKLEGREKDKEERACQSEAK